MQKYFRKTKEDHSQISASGHNWWSLFSLGVETLGLLSHVLFLYLTVHDAGDWVEWVVQAPRQRQEQVRQYSLRLQVIQQIPHINFFFTESS